MTQRFYKFTTTRSGPQLYDRVMRNDDLPLLSLGSVDPATLADEELMRALARAVDRSLADDLFSELFRRYESRVRAWCLSDRVVVLDHGKQIAEGTPDQVVRDPQVLAAYLGPGESARPAGPGGAA